MDPRLAANLAALQEARRALDAIVPDSTPEEIAAAEKAARLAEQERLRRPTPEEAAKAWKAHNRAVARKPSLTIALPEEAIEMWRRGVRRSTGGDKPRDAGRRGPRVGQTAEEQAIARVRQTHDDLLPGQPLEAAIAGWPLPATFYDELPPLCGVERELLAEPSRCDPEPELETAAPARAEGYLMPGMVRRDA